MSDEQPKVFEIPEDHKILEEHIQTALGILVQTLNRTFDKFSKHKNIDLLIMEAVLAEALSKEIKNRLSERGKELINAISDMLVENLKLNKSKLIVLPGIFGNKKEGLS